MADLPSDVVECLVRHLPLIDTMRFATLSRRCRDIVRADGLWRRLLLDDFGVTPRDLHADTSSRRAPTATPPEQVYAALLGMEYTANFTGRQIDRIGFRKVHMGMGTRWLREVSHWAIVYPSPPQNPISHNIVLEFELYGDSGLVRPPPLGMVLGVTWACEGSCVVTVTVNGNVLTSRFAPPSVPVNPRKPLTGGGDQCRSEFKVSADMLRMGVNRIGFRYHAESQKRCYFRKIDMYPEMEPTIRKWTSRRKTIVIVKSNNAG